MKTGKSATSRTRNFATVVYPESAPVDWQQTLAEQFVPAFISPLHNNDLNPTGEKKKDHYHVILMFDSVKTTDQAKEIFELIGGVGCETVKSIRGYARYLCHLDNPEKAQYDPEQVRCLCGADYVSVCSLVIDKYKAIEEIMDYIDSAGIVSYQELMVYCRRERRDWFRVLCDNGTYVIMEYLKSAKWTATQPYKVDKETGEIIENKDYKELL